MLKKMLLLTILTTSSLFAQMIVKNSADEAMMQVTPEGRVGIGVGAPTTDFSQVFIRGSVTTEYNSSEGLQERQYGLWCQSNALNSYNFSGEKVHIGIHANSLASIDANIHYMTGIAIGYGSWSSNAAGSIDISTGINIQSYIQGSTSIAELYDLYIGDPYDSPSTNPGNVAKHFGIWVDHTRPNFFRGAIGIGREPADGFELDVNGQVRMNGFTDTSSDIRFKRSITPLDNALAKVTSLDGVSFEWRNDEFPDKNFSSDTQIGLIAQDVEKVIPEIVHQGEDTYRTVTYAALIPYLVEALKTQQIQMDAMQQRIHELEGN